MRFRLWFTGMMLLTATLACTTPGAVEEPTEPPTAQVVVVTATTGPGGPAEPTVTPFTPAPLGGDGPVFSPQIKFSTEPKPATATRTFKTATKRIYGMWDYAGMSAVDLVRREWYLNGELWIKREEKWDFSKYGASGTMLDVSIFDEEDGLPAGQYELRLFINDAPQFSGGPDFDFRNFTIGIIGDGPGLGPPEGGTVLSPDGKTSASIDQDGTLSVLTSQGQKRSLVSGKVLAGFGWLPDSLHIVYSTKTQDNTGSPLGVDFDLFIINIATSGTTKLNNTGEDLHNPVVSPTGKYIAVLIGNNYGDACGVGRILGIMELDPVGLTRVALNQVNDFSGMTPPSLDSMAYVEPGPDFLMPGVWQSPTTFKTAIRFTCVENQDGDGVFLADVVGKSVNKLAALPRPQ